MDIGIFNDDVKALKESEYSLSSELDLTSAPPTDVSCVSLTNYDKIFPLQSVRSSSNPIEFIISTDGNNYVNLADSYINIICRVTKADGTSCGTSDLACPANLFFHLMIKDLQVFINGKLVSESSNNYPYIAYIQRLLATPENLKTSRLKSEFWYPNAVQDNYEANTGGYKERYALSKQSKSFAMLGQPVAGVFQQARWFPPGTEIRIVMRRNEAKFCLDCKTDSSYAYEIDEATFYVARKPVSSKVIDLHRSQLNLGHTFKYITNDVAIKTLSIPSGLTAITSESVVLGKIPKQMIIGVVKSSAAHGQITESPMNFQASGLKNVLVNWRGQSDMDSIPLNFETGSTSFDNFLVGLNTLEKTTSNSLLWNGISRDNYKNGNVLVAATLLSGMPDAMAAHRQGQISITLEFNTSTPEPYTAIVYCMYQSIIEIDANKEVFVK